MRLIDGYALTKQATNIYKEMLGTDIGHGIGIVTRMISDAPTITIDDLRPKGRWKVKQHKLFGVSYDYVCSNCGCDYALAEYPYCPHCGAKME